MCWMELMIWLKFKSKASSELGHSNSSLEPKFMASVKMIT